MRQPLLLVVALAGGCALWLVLRSPRRSEGERTAPSLSSVAGTVELRSVVDTPEPVPENVAEIVVLTSEEPSSAPAPAATSERLRPRAAKNASTFPEPPPSRILGTLLTTREDGSGERPAVGVHVQAFAVGREQLERFDPLKDWSECDGYQFNSYFAGQSSLMSVLPLQPAGIPLVERTDAGGRFEFSVPSEGWWVVRIAPEALSDWQARGQHAMDAGSLLCFRARGHTFSPVLKLVEPLPPEECISGRVVDDAERPVAGVTVVGWPEGIELERVEDEGASVVTGEDGAFRLCPVDERAWSVRAWPDREHNLLASEALVTQRGQQILLVMPCAALLSGSAIDAETGEPAPILAACAVAAEARSFRRGTTSDERFEIQRLEPGRCVIYVQGLEDRAGLLQDVIVGEERVGNLVVPLVRAMLLEIVGRPGQEPMLVGVSLPGGPPFLLDEAQVGSVTIPLPPGDYVLGTYVPLGLDALESLSTWPCAGRAGEHVRIEL